LLTLNVAFSLQSKNTYFCYYKSNFLHFSQTPIESEEPDHNNSLIQRSASLSKQANSIICMQEVDFQYRFGLPPVLKNLSFSIQPLQKIGIVGRTGAGKTSLTLGLARIIDQTAGQLFIDSLDANSLSLRSNIF
jgi:ABC-type multidrug transport system fused ATPase/permease subunit